MDDPIKIIHKYKNNNGRFQYHINIFLGDILDDNCFRILTKIKDLDLYTTLTTLEERETNILEKNYGEYWYEKFFNSYHINNIKETTLKNSSRMKELRSIYNNQWIGDHFTNYHKRLQTVTFNYEFVVKESRERKMIKKIIQKQQHEMEEIIDYTTIGKKNLEQAQEIMDTEEKEMGEIDLGQDGGGEFGSSNEFGSSDDNLGEDAPDEFDFENLEGEKDIDAFDAEVERDLENVDVYFGEMDETDKNVKLTTKEIKDAISNESYEKINRNIADFDSSKDNSMFDENLKDIYYKNYIRHQYIYKDDNIKNIHYKICCGFKNNNKFGENTYIIPSCQYLWSEYYYEGKIEKVMIGQKWIIKNDILKLDVEPNVNLGVYEDLRGNLRTLRDNIKRQGKIKREDDDNNILLDYEGFFTFNEIYLIDVYNELGLDYDPSFEEFKNLMDVYIKIYFPKIRPDDMKNIIDFLNQNSPEPKKNIERNKLKGVFDTINNDLILENEIMRDIEIVKKKNVKDYTKIFQENYVTQSVIRTYLMNKYQKIDLFRIFDNFILDSTYPFIQYQPTDGTPRYRYSEKYLIENEKKEIIMKWFENSPYGISFKVKVNDKSDYKYMAINLSDNGRIDYKIQWKEEDMSTVDDIKHTYQYIRRLIEKINKENEKFYIRLNIPTNDQFKFAFINTIQKFELPNDFTINHNDLSEFSRYFFPYISLVIEPRKRQSKVKKEEKGEKSKFGTYLRYKRVSKYENKTKIEHRIIFFMRNYEYDDQSLANEISKEFNITEEQAFGEIEATREKYPNLKKSRKVLKKLENIPKYKPPGIGIDIQGKTRTKYKMRIAGARDREQLDRIITFMNILIYLYIETYLYKRPDKQKMKDRLKRLTKIAKRRNKVDEIVNHETIVKSVKQMTAIDKKRLSYNADEDQNQWTRNCQNSGDDKKRRPQQFLNAEDLVKLGYVWNDKLENFQFGHFERKVMVDADSNVDSKKKKKEATLRAVKLPLDDSGENFVYYVCGPEENGKHMYIGFLNKSKNPYGEAMPCCFIKDHLHSKNKDKRNFFLKSIGIIQQEGVEVEKILGEKLYILQDSNKIQEGRFAFLPKYLDIFMNRMLENEKNIKNHYLLRTKTGYYFKYGAKQDEYKYLNALGSVFDFSVDDIKNKMIKILESDKNLSIFTSLNNGDIRTQFETLASYISYIKNNEYLEYPLLNDLLSMPGVIRKDGLNIIIFQKKIKIIKKSLEKEKIKESYHLVCTNQENMDQLKNPKRETAILIKENKNYYPVIMIKKEGDDEKDLNIIKNFHYGEDRRNIINHIFKYYILNCQSEFHVLVKSDVFAAYNAKETSQILFSIGRKEYQPKVQIIDARFKCKFIVTNGGHIVPTYPSGTVYNINISQNMASYIKDYNTTHAYLLEINKLTNTKLKLKPIGIFYRAKKEKSYVVSAIMTEGYDAVPIVDRLMTMEYVKKEKLHVQNKPNDDLIDKEIMSGRQNIVVDNRVYFVSKNKYEVELYQLFRYHLSYYLNQAETGIKFRDKLEKVIGAKMDKKEKRMEIKKLLYQMVDSDLARTFGELLKKVGGGASNPLAQANTPVSIADQKVKTIQLIPEDDQTISPDPSEFDFSQQIPTMNTPFNFARNEKQIPTASHFPSNEKTWIHVLADNKEIEYPSFILKNNRELCYFSNNKESCHLNQHCTWNNNKNVCLLTIRKDMLVDYVNQVSEEFLQGELKAQEILQQGNYFVSDIVNYNIFTERPGEKIIISSSTNLNKILAEIFGKENIPRIGKRRTKMDAALDYDQLNLDNQPKDIGDWYIQNIIENNNTIFRAFANAYYWLLHPFNDQAVRNLGYYSSLQTSLSSIYKGQVVDWLLDSKNTAEIQTLGPYIKYGKIIEFAITMSMDSQTLTNCFLELYTLSKINETIIYIRDENYNIIYVFHPTLGFVYDYQTESKAFAMGQYKSFKKSITIRFIYFTKNISPDKIEVMYPKDDGQKL